MSQFSDQTEVAILAATLADLQSLASKGSEIYIATHFRVDSDAALAAGLCMIALPTAELIFQSADEAVNKNQPNVVGVDIRNGTRSIKGRESSAANIAAMALGELGFTLDSVALEIVAEVNFVDQGKGYLLRRAFTLSRILNCVRSSGWPDESLVLYVRNMLRAHVTQQIKEVVL